MVKQIIQNSFVALAAMSTGINSVAALQIRMRPLAKYEALQTSMRQSKPYLQRAKKQRYKDHYRPLVQQQLNDIVDLEDGDITQEALGSFLKEHREFLSAFKFDHELKQLRDRHQALGEGASKYFQKKELEVQRLVTEQAKQSQDPPLDPYSVNSAEDNFEEKSYIEDQSNQTPVEVGEEEHDQTLEAKRVEIQPADEEYKKGVWQLADSQQSQGKMQQSQGIKLVNGVVWVQGQGLTFVAFDQQGAYLTGNLDLSPECFFQGVCRYR